MAKLGVSFKINVSKIDKSRLIKGAKGVYLDTTVFINLDEADEYGNHGMITQDVTKDERANNVQGPILGNCKVFWRDDAGQKPAKTHKPSQQPIDDDFDSSIPF